MATSNQLMQAVLSLDAYNRTVSNGTPDDVGLYIDVRDLGLAEQLFIEPDSNAVSAGFFATAYELDGQTIISYCGTDFGTGDWVDLALDVVGGWIAGAGITELPLPDADIQTAHAEAFFTQVTGRSIFDDPAGDVILTGHSLGGGLAGFISAISGKMALIFDHMLYAETVNVNTAIGVACAA